MPARPKSVRSNKVLPLAQADEPLAVHKDLSELEEDSLTDDEIRCVCIKINAFQNESSARNGHFFKNIWVG